MIETFQSEYIGKAKEKVVDPDAFDEKELMKKLYQLTKFERLNVIRA